MKKTTVYIIHGYMASPNDHWFQYLKNQLEKDQVLVKVLTMPDPLSPNPTAWQASLEKECHVLDEHTYFVAHSLGAIAVLSYLQSKKLNNPLGGTIFVSGFTDRLPELPILDSFVETQIDFKNIINQIPLRVVFGSPQDTIVPFELTKTFAQNLEAELYSIDNAGHFLTSDGYQSFSHLHQVLISMIES